MPGQSTARAAASAGPGGARVTPAADRSCSGASSERTRSSPRPTSRTPRTPSSIPAAARVGDETILLARVEDLRGISQLHVARSADGVTGWTFDPEPLLRADVDRDPEETWGCEDPRLTWLPEREEWAIAYTAYSRRGPLVSLATTRDFRTRPPPRPGDAARGQGRRALPAPVRRPLGDDPSARRRSAAAPTCGCRTRRTCATGATTSCCSRRATAPGGTPARSASGRRRSRRRRAGW